MDLSRMRQSVQMIFQDPYGSLNPRSTIGRSIAQPMQIAGWRGADIAKRVDELLNSVGLPLEAKGRYPHEFSGGQRQRIGIARALDSGNWSSRPYLDISIASLHKSASSGRTSCRSKTRTEAYPYGVAGRVAKSVEATCWLRVQITMRIRTTSLC